ncbi:hypothetical protein niasHS_007010 [Heterodera schachtii]|uniref:Nuclear receptor domain-containing protein n=1 Tax=Heterodera schachtii TaxID=97005 RepID=A0ABD2JFP6_HETSC
MKSCRACRLDKCLLEGMDPTMVEAEQSAELSQFIQSLYKRREFLQQQLKEKEEKICHMDTETVIENGTPNVRNKAITGLSDAGRRTLQHLSEHYANLLMHYLRTNYGNMAGILRYAELVHLAESVFFNAERGHEFFTYLAMVTDQGRFHAAIPPIFTSMILHGTMDK